MEAGRNRLVKAVESLLSFEQGARYRGKLPLLEQREGAAVSVLSAAYALYGWSLVLPSFFRICLVSPVVGGAGCSQNVRRICGTSREGLKRGGGFGRAVPSKRYAKGMVFCIRIFWKFSELFQYAFNCFSQILPIFLLQDLWNTSFARKEGKPESLKWNYD